MAGNDTLLEAGAVIDTSQATTGLKQLAADTESTASSMTKSFQRVGAESESAMRRVGGHEATEARHAIHGLGEEIGIHVPRFIQSFVSGLGGVAPVLAAAFTPIAIFGLLEVLAEIPEKIREGVDALVGWDEEAKKAYGDALKANVELQVKQEELNEKLRETQLIGATGLGKYSLELNILGQNLQDKGTLLVEFNRRIKEAQAEVEELSKPSTFTSTWGSIPIPEKFTGWLTGTNEQIKEAKQNLEALQAAAKSLQDAIQFKTPVAKSTAKAEQAKADKELNEKTYDEGVELMHRTATEDQRMIDERIRGEQEAERAIDALINAQSDETIKGIVERETAERKFVEDRKRDELETALAGKDAEKARVENELRIGTITSGVARDQLVRLDEEKLQLELAYLNERQAAITARMSGESDALYARDLAELSRIESEKVKVTNEANSAIVADENRTSVAMMKAWQSVTVMLQRGVDSMIEGVLRGTKTIGQAFEEMAGDMIIAMLEAFARMLVAQLVYTATAGAVDKEHSIASILRSAYQAAAHVYAEVPFPFNLVAAPAVFALVAASAAGLPSAGSGALLANDGPIYAHREEMVLPPNLSRGVQSMINQGGAPAGGGPTIYFSPQISAIDARGVAQVLEGQMDTLVSILGRARRENRF